MKTGIVMEGGAMRGLFTAGVIDVLLEKGLTNFDGAIGVSAGACFGCNIKSGQHGRRVSDAILSPASMVEPFDIISGTVRTGDMLPCVH